MGCSFRKDSTVAIVVSFEAEEGKDGEEEKRKKGRDRSIFVRGIGFESQD